VILTRVDSSFKTRRFDGVALATTLFGEKGLVRR
jgi:hypothetical protein